MKLSILIPVYNFKVDKLVQALVDEIERLDAEIEIVILDDASEEVFLDQYNTINSYPFVKFHKNQINVGRAKIRQMLASLAASENLLFLDADVTIIKASFIERYLEICNKLYHVVVGGTNYAEDIPFECNKVLHWKYGKKREEKISITKKAGFTSSNFLIKKSIFSKIPYLDGLTGYGHEDTYWGIWFHQNNYQIRYIPNQILHPVIDCVEIFIAKKKAALHNLLLLELRIPEIFLLQHITLYKWYLYGKKYRLLPVIRVINRFFHKSMIKNLCSCNPNLYFFDFIRLAYFIELHKRPII